MTTKTASIVHFYFGESSYLNRLAQETVPVGLALEGYDRAVLLHHETNAGPFEISKADEKFATVVETPTEGNLIRQINDLGAAGYIVDLYVFAHGTTGRFLVSQGIYGHNAWTTGSRLQEAVKPLNLRAVWQCNCYGASMNSTWRALGAQVTMGTRLVDFYPTRFRAFAKAWASGKEFRDAVRGSDTELVRTPAQAYMLLDAAQRLEEWDGTVLQATTVLGLNEASQRYFKSCWLGDDTPAGKTGRQIMNYASSMVIVGDPTVTR